MTQSPGICQGFFIRWDNNRIIDCVFIVQLKSW